MTKTICDPRLRWSFSIASFIPQSSPAIINSPQALPTTEPNSPDRQRCFRMFLVHFQPIPDAHPRRLFSVASLVPQSCAAIFSSSKDRANDRTESPQAVDVSAKRSPSTSNRSPMHDRCVPPGEKSVGTARWFNHASFRSR